MISADANSRIAVESRGPSGVRPVVRGSTCPRFQLLGLGLGQDLSEHLWGSEFFAVWMTLDDPNPNPNTNPRTSGPSDN